MTLGNMRELGVHHLIGFCLNDACRSVSDRPHSAHGWPMLIASNANAMTLTAINAKHYNEDSFVNCHIVIDQSAHTGSNGL